jgi:predicted lysophospholipase L1 biosynthesis ABC-type transport system permease subunit
MSPFWATLFQHLRHYGRNATLFIVALTAIAGLCVLAAIIQVNGLQQYLVYVWPPAVIAALIFICRALLRARARRRERLRRQPLSQDELRAALSKLRGNKNLHSC